MISNSYVPSNQSREPKMRVRLPGQSAVQLFPGWGPKF
jgi:hypothetical protein